MWEAQPNTYYSEHQTSTTEGSPHDEGNHVHNGLVENNQHPHNLPPLFPHPNQGNGKANDKDDDTKDVDSITCSYSLLSYGSAVGPVVFQLRHKVGAVGVIGKGEVVALSTSSPVNNVGILSLSLGEGSTDKIVWY